jgi:hypothetical protein
MSSGFVYSAIPCLTGALHSQPDTVRDAFAFTTDYRVEVDLRQAIDAPECVPVGSVSAQRWAGQDGIEHVLLVAHFWRDRGLVSSQ